MIILLMAVFALLPTGDHDLLKYRLPDVLVSSFDLTMYQDGQTYMPYTDQRLQFSISPNCHALISGERLNLQLDADVGLGGTPVAVSGSGVFGMSQTAYDFGPGVSVSADWYPIAFPIGLGGDLDVWSGFSWRHEMPLSDSSLEVERVRRWDHVSAAADVGPTLGRLRDARTVVQALRIIELLNQENQLRRRAEEDDIQSLAVLLASRPAFALRYRQPEKNWIGGLGTLLKNRGLVQNQVPARTWFLIREALEDANSVPRPVGVRFSVRPGLASDWDSKLDSTPDTTMRLVTHTRQPSLVMRLESGYPPSRRWQVGENASWTIASDSFLTRHNLDANVALTYYAFDRLLVSFDYTGSYTNHYYWYSGTHGEAWDIWKHSLDLSASYHREDMLWVNASIGYELGGYRFESVQGTPVSRAGLTWRLSARYRLLP